MYYNQPPQPLRRSITVALVENARPHGAIRLREDELQRLATLRHLVQHQVQLHIGVVKRPPRIVRLDLPKQRLPLEQRIARHFQGERPRSEDDLHVARAQLAVDG
eukprot:scaffold61712_cov69-Phaeocystis_antarctica.AAC.15